MRQLTSSLIVISGLATMLAGCARHVEKVASEEFRPIHVTAEAVQPRAVPDGAIYRPGKGGLFAVDRRARAVGDILTVSLSESFSATKAQTASSSKNDSFDVTMPIGLPNALTGGFTAGQLTSGTTRSFAGAGTAAQSNSVSGFLSVTVMRVFDNGNMEIAGQKQLNLNNGDEYVRLTGIVRPQDITASNIILSNRIADAQITYIGAGDVADSSKQGWLSRTLRAIAPF